MLHWGSAVPEEPCSGGLGDPLEPPWSLRLGAWLPPPAMARAWELKQIIQAPPPQAGREPCAGITPACTARSRAGSAAQPRGDDALDWPLAAPRHPTGTQPGYRGGPHEKSSPRVSPKTPAAAGHKVPSVGWGPPRWGWRGSVHRGGMRGRDAGPWLGLAVTPCPGWLPEQCTATPLFSGPVRIIEF